MNLPAIPPALLSVLIVVLGALVILVLAARLSGNSGVLATIGAVTLVVAALPVLVRGDALSRVAVLDIARVLLLRLLASLFGDSAPLSPPPGVRS